MLIGSTATSVTASQWSKPVLKFGDLKSFDVAALGSNTTPNSGRLC